MLRGTVGGWSSQSLSCREEGVKKNDKWKTILTASMGWKSKGNTCKIRWIPLGWELRQKLGIIPEEEEDFLQRSLHPSYERHPNHWESPPRSSPPGYLSLANKPPCTSEGPHNMTSEPRNTLQEHISKRYEESMNVIFHPWEGSNRKSTQKPT